MIHITNNTELSEVFKSKELQNFLQELLRDLDENPYALKSFLKKGYKEAYNDLMAQFRKSFVAITPLVKEKDAYHRVMRCIDEVEFVVGDLVTYGNGNDALPIGRMYSDDRGLHVQLKVDNKGTITWRDLSYIEHAV